MKKVNCLNGMCTDELCTRVVFGTHFFILSFSFNANIEEIKGLTLSLNNDVCQGEGRVKGLLRNVRQKYVRRSRALYPDSFQSDVYRFNASVNP
jgi:hypothetical protein